MDKFKIKTYVPTTSEYTYLKELKNKKYIEINKYILSNDNDGIERFFNNVLKKSNIKTNFDKFFSLVNLRMVSVGNTINIQLNRENEPTSTLKITLLNFLNRLIENCEKPIKDFTKESLRITFNLPSRLYFKNFIILLLDCIKEIYLDDVSLDFKNYSLKEKTNLLLKLKKEIIKDLKKHILSNCTKYELVQIQNSNFKYTVSFYNNTAFELLKFLFKTKISNLYNKIFFCSQRLNLSYSDFCNTTPSETDLLIAIYKQNNSIK